MIRFQEAIETILTGKTRRFWKSGAIGTTWDVRRDPEIQMYTVMKFSIDGSDVVLRRAGEQLNSIRPGSFDGEINDGSFGVSVVDSPSWWDHLDGMEKFLETCGPLIRKSRAKKIDAVFSVAVWPRDYEKYNALGLPLYGELIEAMARFGVMIMFRIYYMKDRESSASNARKRKKGVRKKGPKTSTRKRSATV